MSDYLFKNIPEKTWIAAKHCAVDEKVSIKEFIIRALISYIRICKQGRINLGKE